MKPGKPWREILDAPKMVKTWGGITIACGVVAGVVLTLMGISAVADERQRQYELEHPRWTDKNRWPHGE